MPCRHLVGLERIPVPYCHDRGGGVLFAGKLVALIFAEAVTIAWWVRAMNGRHLRQLTHDFDASRSIAAVIKSPKLFSWICLGSIAFTGFSGLGMILQQATTTKAVPETVFNVSMTAPLATRLPYGWSGQAYTPDNTIPAYSRAMGRIIHDYQKNVPVHLNIHGCNQSDSSICNMALPGFGFRFDCSGSTGLLQSYPPSHMRNLTLWSVGVGWQAAPHSVPLTPDPGSPQSVPYTQSEQPDRIDLRVFWKNLTGCRGEKLVVQNCVPVPAIVEYPIQSTSNVATLRPATERFNWLTQHDGFPEMPVDKVLQVLQNTSEQDARGNTAPTTWGGVARLFSDLWASKIQYFRDEKDYNILRYQATSLFASSFQLKSKWESPLPKADAPNDACYNRFDSPMMDLADGIRQVMFRISIEVANGSIKDDLFYTSDMKELFPPVQNYTDSSAYYHHTVNTYRSKYLYLWLGIGLMMLALACIIPLFWHFWKLGCRVSLSPTELATALHTSSTRDTQGSSGANAFDLVKQKLDGNSLSNADTKELVTIMGDIKVKYCQVAQQTLGLAVDGTVEPPNHGQSYR